MGNLKKGCGGGEGKIARKLGENKKFGIFLLGKIFLLGREIFHWEFLFWGKFFLGKLFREEILKSKFFTGKIYLPERKLFTGKFLFSG